MPDAQFRAALWSAVSSAAQAAADKISLVDQLDKGRAVCKARGWRVVAELKVEGHSREYSSLDSAMRDIPELARLMALARAGEINLFVPYDTNRLRGLQSVVIKTLASYGVQTYSLSQPLEPADPATFRYYHSDTQSIMTHVGSLISDVELSTMRRRYSVGMPRRVDTLGLHYNNHIPYGYRKPAGHELDRRTVAEQVPAECAVLLEMRCRYLQGASASSIAEWLTTANVAPPRDRWSHKRVLDVLSNPYYAGLVVRNRNTVRRDLVTGKRIAVAHPWQDWKLAPGRHVGLWTEADWRHIMEVKARRGSRVLGQVKHTRAFSRLMVCAACGGTLMADGTLDSGGQVYRCMRGPSKAGHGRVIEPAAIDELHTFLEALLTGPLPAMPEQGGGLDSAAVAHALSDNDAARARLQRLYARGGISDGDMDLRLAELAVERETLERLAADADSQADRAARQSRRVRVAADLLADYEALWSGPPERANAVISDLVELILVRGRKITDIIVRQ